LRELAEITEGFFIHRKPQRTQRLFFMPILEIENRHKTLNPSGIINISFLLKRDGKKLCASLWELCER